MAGVHIVIPWFLAIPLAAFCAVWIYRDANERGMESADIWAVGMFLAFFIPPIIVYAFYLRKRKPRRGHSSAVPAK